MSTVNTFLHFPAMITRIGAVDGGVGSSRFGPPKSIDREKMEFEAVVTTDAPAFVTDSDGYLIEEILVSAGGVFPASMPLLDSHVRYSVGNVLGAIGSFRRSGGSWIGRGQLTPGVQESEDAFKKIVAGHLDSLSIGYWVREFYRVAPGKTRTINGVEYSAGNGQLRVATKWQVFETSLVAVPADSAAKIRHSAELRTDLTPRPRKRIGLVPGGSIQPTRRRMRYV